MKFIIIVACVAVLVVSTQAQRVRTTTEADGGPGGPGGPEPGGPEPGGPEPGGPATDGPEPGGPRETVVCKGRVRSPSCFGLKHEGNSNGHLCHEHANRRMWYYNRRQQECQRMAYKGCGGNRNRFCSKSACDRACNRGGGD